MRIFYLVYQDSNVNNILAIFTNEADAVAFKGAQPYADIMECTIPYALLLRRETINLG